MSEVDTLGSLEIANVLLGRRDVEADYRDYNGRTPISYVAQCGTIAIVRLLLERDDVVCIRIQAREMAER